MLHFAIWDSKLTIKLVYTKVQVPNIIKGCLKDKAGSLFHLWRQVLEEIQ